MTQRRSDSFKAGFERFLEFVVLALMVALAVVVVVGVVFRKAGAALVWYDEVASILLSWLTYYGASLAALKRAHIAFPTLVKSMRPRFQAYLLIFREVVVIVSRCPARLRTPWYRSNVRVRTSKQEAYARTTIRSIGNSTAFAIGN